MASDAMKMVDGEDDGLSLEDLMVEMVEKVVQLF